MQKRSLLLSRVVWRRTGVDQVRFRLGCVCVILAVVWVVWVKLLMPDIVERISDSHLLVGNIIARLEQRMYTAQLPLWDAIALAGASVCLCFAVLVLSTTNASFFQRFVGEATPGSLGAIRVLTCAILLANVLWEDLPSTVLLPDEMRHPLGLMHLFYALPLDFTRFVKSTAALQALQGLTVLLLFLGMVGWKTRFVVPLSAFCYFLVGGILRQPTKYFHVGIVPLYVLTVLAFTPCGDGWSLDRLWKVWLGKDLRSDTYTAPIYGWSRYACWVAIALTYLSAGTSKLRQGGLFWWNATNLKSIMLTDSLNPMQFDWGIAPHLATAPDFFFALIGLAALLGELLYVLVLFSRPARWVFPPLLFSMHLGIWLLQNVLFFDLILVQLIFIDCIVICQGLGRQLRAHFGVVQVLYDGYCPICRRTMRLLRCFDLLGMLDLINFRSLNLDTFCRGHSVNLQQQQLEEDMHVVFRERVYRGFYGYRVIALALPMFWLVAPFWFVPGVSALGARAYGYVAHNRFNLLKCDASCSLEPVNQVELAAPASPSNAVASLTAPLLVSLLGIVLLIVGAFHVEFYPFTALPMYSGSRSEGVITYYKLLAHYTSGAVERAYPENVIGAMADSRYRGTITKCFKPTTQPICQKFLVAAGTAYNAQAIGTRQIAWFEVQQWTWDFRAAPTDPQRGRMLERVVVPLTISKTTP